MKSDADFPILRRDFLKLAGAATAFGLTRSAFATGGERVCLIVDPENPAASSGPAKRAMLQLCQELETKGFSCELAHSVEAAADASFCVVASAPASQLAQGFPKAAEVTIPESLRLSPGKVGSVPGVLVSARDERGFVYGLLELAERSRSSSDPVAALHLKQIVEDKPANGVRGVGRYFCCEMEDKPWYDNKAFWSGYLDTLIACRFKS